MAITKSVTPAQLDACTRVIDEQNHEVFYLVQSATDVTVSYQVRFNERFSRYTCQCKANANGISCWHVRAAIEAATQYAQAIRDQAEAEAIAEKLETWTRVCNARPTCYTEAEIARDLYQPRPFAIVDDGAAERERAQSRNVLHQCSDGSWW